MPTAADQTIATLVVVVVTASFPFFVYGAWVILQVETVTWSVLMRHLKFIAIGLLLTTVPILVWMLPRLLDQFDGFTRLHTFLGLQAYALLVFGLTGIIRIFQAKRTHNLYHQPEQNINIDEIHEDMGAWRFRLRVGVFGYLLFWMLAWIVGVIRYLIVYNIL